MDLLSNSIVDVYLNQKKNSFVYGMYTTSLRELSYILIDIYIKCIVCNTYRITLELLRTVFTKQIYAFDFCHNL
jgi:hypothetical protein